MKISEFIVIILISSLSINIYCQDGFCPELDTIGCSCLESDVKLKCDDFLYFKDLDFAILTNNSPLRTRLEELELSPTGHQEELNSSLILSPLSMKDDGKVILRNINGFQYNSNPFDELTISRNLSLTIINSVFRTTDSTCSPNTFEFDNIGLFTKFSKLYLGENLTYTSTFCPLAFYNVQMSLIEAIEQSEENYLQFDGFLDMIDAFELKSEVSVFRIRDSQNVIVNNRMLDPFIFENLSELWLDNVELREIEDTAFEFTQKLTTINLGLNNVEEFLQSSENQWMR